MAVDTKASVLLLPATCVLNAPLSFLVIEPPGYGAVPRRFSFLAPCFHRTATCGAPETPVAKHILFPIASSPLLSYSQEH